jgi:hypothetical protein
MHIIPRNYLCTTLQNNSRKDGIKCFIFFAKYSPWGFSSFIHKSFTETCTILIKIISKSNSSIQYYYIRNKWSW